MKIDNIHKIVLRTMNVDDIPAVERVEQTCFSDAWSEKLLSDMLASKWDEAWVLAAEDGTVIGYANFRFLAGEGELMRIAVLPEHRGRGESKKLMDRLEISAKEKEALPYIVFSIQMICVAYFSESEKYAELAKINQKMLRQLIAHRDMLTLD